jgi:hypothetical protein
VSAPVLILALLVGLALLAGLLVGIVHGARTQPAYRQTVDRGFAAGATAVIDASQATGIQLATVLADPGALGRQLLESRLQQLAQSTASESNAASLLSPPPPDANAAAVVNQTMQLRDHAVRLIRQTLEGLLGLTPSHPVGTAGAEPPASPPVTVSAAALQLRIAGDQIAAADRVYGALLPSFSLAGHGAQLPTSQWAPTPASTLAPASLASSAATTATDPHLAASVSLAITAVRTDPAPLPVAGVVKVVPTTTFQVWVSVVNGGSAPSIVSAVVQIRPVGTLGTYDDSHAAGSVASGGAVALTFLPLRVTPGATYLLTVDLVRPGRQLTAAGLHWQRTLVIAPGVA